MQVVEPNLPPGNNKHEAVVLLSDMINYFQHVSSLPLGEIRNFMLNYHSTIREIIRSKGSKRLTFEPTEGDGTVAIFGCMGIEEKIEAATSAVDTAIAIAKAITAKELTPSRIGLFSGHMLEATLDQQTLRFSLAFAAARRLETLCDYFSTSFLMGKEVATLQAHHRENVVSIGKITPKHFDHPVEIYTVYTPGLHNIPIDVDTTLLQEFISLKNEAVTYFCGSKELDVAPNFRTAKVLLHAAQDVFRKMSDTRDLATDRLLQYIEENPLPSIAFIENGMRIMERHHTYHDNNLPSMAHSLLRSFDKQLYDSIMILNKVEKELELLWRSKEDVLVEYGAAPDGIYIIVTGTARVLDADGVQIDQIGAGELFGEIAYLAGTARRHATVVANTDMILRKMDGKHLRKFPELQHLFPPIALHRLVNEG